MINRKRRNLERISTKYDNAKAYWRLLKWATNKNMKRSISSKQFADYFKAIKDPGDRFFTDWRGYFIFYVRGEFQIMFDELNSGILRNELLTAIKQLRNGASSGPDLLLNEFFKTGSETLVT